MSTLSCLAFNPWYTISFCYNTHFQCIHCSQSIFETSLTQVKTLYECFCSIILYQVQIFFNRIFLEHSFHFHSQFDIMYKEAKIGGMTLHICKLFVINFKPCTQTPHSIHEHLFPTAIHYYRLSHIRAIYTGITKPEFFSHSGFSLEVARQLPLNTAKNPPPKCGFLKLCRFFTGFLPNVCSPLTGIIRVFGHMGHDLPVICSLIRSPRRTVHYAALRSRSRAFAPRTKKPV